MGRKQIRGKPADKGQDQDTTLVKLYLPTAIRNRLSAYATLLGVNMNEAAAKILYERLSQWKEVNEAEVLPLPAWDEVWAAEQKALAAKPKDR